MEAIGSKQDKEWQKLRKQKMALEARLSSRIQESGRAEKIKQVGEVSKALLDMVYELLNAEKKKELSKRI